MARRILAKEALENFAGLMAKHDVPEHIRSDNGPEMVAGRLRERLEHKASKTAYITPRKPRENGCRESFNGRLNQLNNWTKRYGHPILNSG